MISCKRAAELISRALEMPLSLRDRLSLHFHLAACGMCRRFRRQSKLLDQAGALSGEPHDHATQIAQAVSGAVLSEVARARIQQALDQGQIGGRD